MLAQMIRKQMEQAYHACSETIDHAAYQQLLVPQREVSAHLFVRGKKYEAFRIQYNNWLGPYKGGIRFHHQADKDECNALAFWMTIKNALHGLPLGGGKGCVVVNPSTLSQEELKEVCEAYATAFHDVLGEKKDIPAPDVGSNGMMMKWMNDQYRHFHPESGMGTFTGKPVEHGGSQGRTEATGYGVAVVTKEYILHHHMKLEESSFIIQGFGNVGSFTASYLDSWGMELKAVADHTGYYRRVDQSKLDVTHLHQLSSKTGSLQSCLSDQELCMERISADEFWKTKCTVVIPAALERQIDERVAGLLDCKVVMEAANGPITPEAELVLFEKNIDFLPDCVCNSGGVVCSYYEMLQNDSNEKWSKEYVLDKLRDHMISVFNSMYTEQSHRNKRIEAYTIALRRLCPIHFF